MPPFCNIIYITSLLILADKYLSAAFGQSTNNQNGPYSTLVLSVPA